MSNKNVQTIPELTSPTEPTTHHEEADLLMAALREVAKARGKSLASSPTSVLVSAIAW